MTGQAVDIVLRQIEPGDKVSGFSVGEHFVPLKMFLRKDSKKFHISNLATTYVLANSDAKIIGYITLVAGQIETDGNVDQLIGTDNLSYSHPLPSVKIARLAVDTKFRGHGLGIKLIQFTFGLVLDNIMGKIGCRFIVVDAKKMSVDFYIKQGFRLLDTETNKTSEHPIMFIDLHKLTSIN